MKSNTTTKKSFVKGTKVVIANVKDASAVGYIGVWMTICGQTKRLADGDTAHLCISENGNYSWWRASEMKIISK